MNSKFGRPSLYSVLLENEDMDEPKILKNKKKEKGQIIPEPHPDIFTSSIEVMNSKFGRPSLYSVLSKDRDTDEPGISKNEKSKKGQTVGESYQDIFTFGIASRVFYFAIAGSPSKEDNVGFKICQICKEKKKYGFCNEIRPHAACDLFDGYFNGDNNEDHRNFCRGCLADLVISKIKEASGPIFIKCPYPPCKRFLPQSVVNKLLWCSGKDKYGKLYRKYSTIQRATYENRLKELFWDKYPKDEATIQWLKENTRYCPTCRVLIEKAEGCNEITCVCGSEFCFSCGKTIRLCKCAQELHHNRAEDAGEDEDEDEDECDNYYEVKTPFNELQSLMKGAKPCYYCGKNDHLIKDCQVLKREKSRREHQKEKLKFQTERGGFEEEQKRLKFLEELKADEIKKRMEDKSQSKSSNHTKRGHSYGTFGKDKRFLLSSDNEIIELGFKY